MTSTPNPPPSAGDGDDFDLADALDEPGERRGRGLAVTDRKLERQRWKWAGPSS